MLGIMLKDFYQAFCIRKNLINFVFGFLTYFVLFFAMPSKYTVMLLVCLTIPMISVSPLQYSIERDELSKFDQIILTYPISKKKIVVPKLLETYIFSFVCLFTLSIPIVLTAVYGYKFLDFNDGVLILVESAIFTLIMLPINNAGFMMLGNKKGTIMYVVILSFFVIGFLILNFAVGVEQLLSISLYQWLFYGGMLAVILNIAGYFACLKIYDIRHS